MNIAQDYTNNQVLHGTRFLNRIFAAVDICINGGKDYWSSDPENLSALPLELVHDKFLGDGAMYIWKPKGEATDFSPKTIRNICARLWILKCSFNEILKECADDVPVVDLPPRIRFGLSKGTIYELPYKNSRKKEYIGFCINLASMLQRYCPDLGFIASARIEMPSEIIEKASWIKVVVKKIKTQTKEIVIIDKGEFEELSDDVK